jgi:sulfofructose kinase
LGVPLIIDAGSWSDSVKTLSALADHVIASEQCARAALATSDDITTVEPNALRLAFGVSAQTTLIVTLGPRGLLWSRGSDHGAMPSIQVHTVDSTGAGDAFHGAYAYYLAKGLPFEQILRLASAAGAIACTKQGAWPAVATHQELIQLTES